MTESEALEDISNFAIGINKEVSNIALGMAIKALEKQIPKKTVHNGCFDTWGVWHEWNGIGGRPYELCPTCRKNLCCEMPCDPKPSHCVYCGQKLKWSDEQEGE